jgi:hypothetical protein
LAGVADHFITKGHRDFIFPRVFFRFHAALRQRNHLVGVKVTVWRAKQHGQHPLAYFGEQSVCKGGGLSWIG